MITNENIDIFSHNEAPIRRREQEVWQACDELWATHGNPKMLTGDCIREHLMNMGKSKGSPNEIYKYRKTWEQNRKVSLLGAEKAANSSILSDPISRAVKMVYENITQEHKEELAKVEELHQGLMEEKNTEITNLKESITEILKQLTESQDQLAEKNNNISEIEKINTALKDQIGFLQQEKTQLSEQISQWEHKLLETKNAHEKEIERIQSLFMTQLDTCNSEKHALEEKLISQGQQFSEQLLELKTSLHNQEITQKKAQEAYSEEKKQVEHLKKKLSDIAKNFNEKEKTIIEFKTILNEKKLQLYHLDKQYKQTLAALVRARGGI